MENYIERSVHLARLGGVPVDIYDLLLIRQWLSLMFERGTDGIKIVAGYEANTWVVTVLPK